MCGPTLDFADGGDKACRNATVCSVSFCNGTQDYSVGNATWVFEDYFNETAILVAGDPEAAPFPIWGASGDSFPTAPRMDTHEEIREGFESGLSSPTSAEEYKGVCLEPGETAGSSEEEN